MEYKIIKEIIMNEELGKYVTYGIAIYNEGKLLRKISDVSTSKNMVNDLCVSCNQLKLNPIHIDDVIEDNL